MKFKERKEFVDSLHELLDFFENDPASWHLPVPYISVSRHIYEYGVDENGNKNYETVDEFTTRLRMREIAKAMKPCEKNYNGTNFTLQRKFGKSITLRYTTSRDAVCEKKVVSTKTIPARLVEAYVEEQVEWVCKDSLLAP